MCNFFSFVGDGFGNFHCIGWETRQKMLRGNYLADSHTVILTKLGVPPKMQDRWDKYEYNPLTKLFTVDQGIDGHDHDAARSWVENLDFKRVVEPLIIKPIFNPLSTPAVIPTAADIADLKLWDSLVAGVWAGVGDSEGYSVAARLGANVGYSVAASLGASVGASVKDSLWASSWYSLWYSLGASVRYSLWASAVASVWAYVSSFFNIDYKYDFTPAIRLWERGLVPSFDGKVWRLHSGPDAEIVYTLKND